MAIFDIEKDELLQLSDAQLEELIARLAEAEVASYCHSPAWVSWSGSINAPDGGVDIHIQVPVDKLNTGFLERPDTIFQAKKYSMPKAAITKEMTTDRALLPIISEQAGKGGSYIIVSLGDDCSPLMQDARLKAMQDAVENDPNSSNIHLGFYDRSKLTLWLRQHPSVMLWVKRKLGRGYSGWQPYGAWSNPPQNVEDTLISAPGVKISLPSGKGQNLSIGDAIGPMRDLIRTTNKAIRITGLSGVGKTRIVQALFDETVGTDALDRTVAVYVDTGAEPQPSATAMLDKLIAEGRRAIMILDNCPSELHSSLASKVSATDGKVRLITIEYDIRDDKPQTTKVIHIEAVGPEVSELLLIRRFPNIGLNNARRIAEFADGNARVSLAIAERVEEGESLAQLSDAQLFNRLFEQRNHPDDDLREQAEILSLVYSFSVSNSEAGPNELEILGSLSGYSQSQLFRSVKRLLDRHVVQKRSHWRAILPHAIANKLAASALDSISVDLLRAAFEAPGRQRLLMSFAHRLGLLHDHPVAKKIGRAFITVLGFTAGGSLAFYTFTTYMQKYLVNTAGMHAKTASGLMTLALFIFMLLQPFFGALSDKIGRRSSMLCFGGFAALLTVPILTVLQSVTSPVLAFSLVMLSLIIVSFYTSISGILKAEMFPPEVRALGVGLSYAVANALFGGSAEYVALSLKSFGMETAFFWYVSAMGAIAFIVSLTLHRKGKGMKL